MQVVIVSTWPLRVLEFCVERAQKLGHLHRNSCSGRVLTRGLLRRQPKTAQLLYIKSCTENPPTGSSSFVSSPSPPHACRAVMEMLSWTSCQLQTVEARSLRIPQAHVRLVKFNNPTTPRARKNIETTAGGGPFCGGWRMTTIMQCNGERA